MSANFVYGKWLSTPEKGEEVVVSGMAGKFPESDNIAQFKEHLIKKEDMVTAKPEDGIMCPIARSARIPKLDGFDCGFFGVHCRQSKYMDPMIRVLLEIAIESIIDAGINPKELEGSRTGVFISCSGADNECKTTFDLDEPHNFRMTGVLRSCAAHRLSCFLKLNGPSYALDSACSSSVNAIQHAFNCIRSGECDNAIFGCMNVTIPAITRNFNRIGFLSTDGIPKVFDEKASGFVRGDTTGCFFLQKSKDARRIYGTIIHAKINDDGYKIEGITSPSTQAQSELLEEIYLESGMDVNELCYFEAHATGTKVGDPLEVAGIDNAIGKKRKDPLWIGSVKSNIGHGEHASGFSSICKVLLAFETGAIPANLHFQKARPDIEAFSAKRLKVVTENVPLTQENALVGVNNFGFGGNNSHVILRRYPKKKLVIQENSVSLERILCVSGRTEEAVRLLIQEIKKNRRDMEYIALLQHVFSRNMYDHPYRGYVVLTEEDADLESIGIHKSCERSSLNLVFGDFDECYKNVGRSLWDFPIFHSILNNLNQPHMLNFDIFELIKSDLIDNSKDIIAGFCMQVAIRELFNALGLGIGHSYGVTPVGQLAAAYSKNEMPVENILNVLCRKSYKAELKLKNGIEKAREQNKFLKDSLVFSNKNGIWSARNPRLSFLELLGSLYQQGHELKLFELYPKIDFPVSRSTPMISPSILWDHAKQWRTHLNDPPVVIKKGEKTFKLDCNLEDDKYLLGHVVDGRNLIPATGFLYLVWDSLAQIKDTLADDLPVIFEKCRFISAVTVPSDGKLQFLVTIQPGSGLFEVIHDDITVATGKIVAGTHPELHKVSQETLFGVEDPDLIMNHDEIYKELSLRGYNYSDFFRAIEKCNLDATKSVIKWNNNWVSFLDNMLQLKLLFHDTRLLYIPVYIDRLCIDPVAHLQTVKELDGEALIPVTCCKSTQTIKTGAIQFKGLLPSSIQRRKNQNEPVLEKYLFVPNVTDLELKEGLRVVIQLILENSQAVVFNAVEKIEDEPESLLSIISDILQDIPLIKPDLTISTKKMVKSVNYVKVEHVSLTSDSNILLLIGSKISSSSQLIPCVKQDGFILSREDHDFDPSSFRQPNLVLLLAITSEREKLVLIRRSAQIVKKITAVKITSENLNWMPDLQKLINNGSRVVVYSQNEFLSGILGLINCLRRENNGSNLQGFFITDKTAPEFDLDHPFYKEQLLKNYAFNIYEDGTWGTYRHLVLEDCNQQLREHAYVNILERGKFTSLTWLEGPLHLEENNLGNKETLVIPYFCSLNFRDIVIASGRINMDAHIATRMLQECLLGSEFAGRTVDGKRVMGFGSGGCLASLIKADTNSLINVPQNWTLEDAATTVILYMTVIYGLILRSKSLKSGKSILIHCGAGGIGMAAINMALHYNMQVFTTVGTQEKRDFIMKKYPQLKESHVGNSRDTSFVSMIKRATNGRGVDVILNSLTAEKLFESINCLAYGGSFLEIGKFDLLRNSPLQLLLLKKEATFHGVMIDHHIGGDLIVAKELIDNVNKEIRLGAVKPLHRTVFPENKMEDAFRYMMTGKHVGKVLVQLREEEPQKIKLPTRMLYKANPRLSCNPDHVQIVIGGLGGVGLELADWLVLRGAKILLLSTRNGITSGYQQQRINVWGSYGVKVVVSTADVTTRNGCEKLIHEGHNFGPIEGIFNLAVILKDAAFENQSQESFGIPFGPKARAVQYLDAVTRQSCPNLRYFVVFSSAACGRGNPGQTNYAMANSIMERICEKRKQEGYPALAIQWGAIGDVGLVAKMQKELKVLEISGTLLQRISHCMSLMDRFMNQNHPIVSSMIVAEKKRDFGSGCAVEAVAHILGVKDLNSVVVTTPLAELGMDSLTGGEIVQVLEKEFEIYITPENMKNLTFEKLRHLQAARTSSDNNIEQKTTLALANLLEFLPNPETGYLPIMEMPSNNNNNIVENETLLFVLPGIESLLSNLEEITKGIGANVLGLQYDHEDPLSSLKKIVNRLLPHIKEKLGNSRTFYIMAYSFGVLVALEIAHSLESNGYQGTIFAIDGAPDYLTGVRKLFTTSENEDVIQIDIILQLLQKILPVGVVEANKDKIINAKSKEERFDFAAQLLKRKDSPNYKLEKMVFQSLCSRYHNMVFYDYSHGNKLKSSVKLYRVSQPMITDVEEDYGLSQLIEKDVEVMELDADHVTVLKQISIADDINKVLPKDTTKKLGT